MQSSKLFRSALTLRCSSSLRLPICISQIPSRPYSTPNNTDRFAGPVSTPSKMQAVKNTIAENLGQIVPNAHELAPADSQFSLDQVPDLTDKVAVVTGGSEGIGYGCTHTLLSHNISKLFIISQSEDIANDAISAIRSEMGEEKANRVVWLQCNLADWAAVSKTAFSISSQTDRIDMLINNAARGIMTYQLAENGIDLHMAINHMGHVILTSHLLPVLKKTASQGHKVRLVQLGSNVHESAPKDLKFESVDELNTDLGPQVQYARSKLAAILYARYLNRHLTSQHPNILSNAVHPGIVKTRQSQELIHEAYPLGGYAMSVALAPFKKSQFEGCVSAMFAATTTEASGLYICPPAIVEPGSGQANDEELGERLMELTWKVVREKTKSESVDKGCPFRES